MSYIKRDLGENICPKIRVMSHLECYKSTRRLVPFPALAADILSGSLPHLLSIHSNICRQRFPDQEQQLAGDRHDCAIAAGTLL